MLVRTVAEIPERLEAIPVALPDTNGRIEPPSIPAKGLVLLVNGCDGNRYGLCNDYVSAVLRAAGFATLMLDLSNDPALSNRAALSDIPSLADLLVSRAEACRQLEEFRSLPLGFFGAGIGAAVAFVAAARLDKQVGALVSCGGRLDCGGIGFIDGVPPTLIIADRADRDGLVRNRGLLRQLGGRSRLEVVPDGFDQPDTLEIVVELTLRWFRIHLRHKARGEATHRFEMVAARNVGGTEPAARL